MLSGQRYQPSYRLNRQHESTSHHAWHKNIRDRTYLTLNAQVDYKQAYGSQCRLGLYQIYQVKIIYARY